MEKNELQTYVRDVPDFPKEGILFRDITPLLSDQNALSAAIDRLVEPWLNDQIDVVAGAESRGFIFGAAVAERLSAGFIPIRKPGKLPCEVYSEKYDLEYGVDHLEVHQGIIEKGQRVLLIDDLLATGGTLEACCKLVIKCGGVVAGCGVLIELMNLNGRQRLKPYKVIGVLEYC